MGEKPTEKKPEKPYKTVELNDELKKKNEDAKKIADELMRIGVWTWDGRPEDIVNFAFAEPERAMRIAKYIESNNTYDTKDITVISGAEYRHKFAVMRAIKVVDKMNPEVQKLVYQDLFNRDTMPDFEKDEQIVKTGLRKLFKYQQVIAGEYTARGFKDEKGVTATPASGTKAAPSGGTGEPKVSEPPKTDTSKGGGNDYSEDMSSLFDEEWPARTMAELREQSARRTAALDSLGLPGSIADALNAANLQLAGVSANAEAPKLAFAKAKTQTSKDAVVAA